MSHWTQGNVGDFVYSISLDFFTQLEDRIQESKLQQKELAERLEITPSAVSQMLSSPPGKPELETLVKYALAVGSKVSVVLYDDDDPNNERGPVYSGIFEKSWEALNKPRDLEALSEAAQQIVSVTHINAAYINAASLNWNVVGTGYWYDPSLAGQMWGMPIKLDWYPKAALSRVELPEGYRSNQQVIHLLREEHQAA